MKALLLTPLASPFLEQPFRLLETYSPPIQVHPVFYGDGSHRPTWGKLGWVGENLKGGWAERKRELDRIWDAVRPDLLIVSQYRSRECRYMRKKALKEGVPFYMLFVEPFIPSGLIKHQIKRFMFKRFCKGASGLGVMGKSAHKEYGQLYDGPIIDCPYTFDLSYLLSFGDEHRPKDKTVFIYSGRMVEFRNPLGTVRVFAELCRLYPGKVGLIMSGTGELEGEVMKLIDDLEIRESVRWMNEFKDWEDIRNLYRYGHVLLSLGKYSTWNLTIGEAMAAGMAVIATHTTEAASTQIVHSYNGYLVNYEDEVAMISAMIEYIKDSRLLRLHAERGREVTKTSNYEKIAKRIHCLLLNNHKFIEDEK